MEKIQQAIDKARTARGGKPGGGPQQTKNEADISSIKYTKTQQINSPVDVQLENRIVNVRENSAYADAFKILGTQIIQRMEENHWKSLAVAGVCAGEGATTTTINLGISIAKEVEYTVLVVDANLRNPALHKHFGIKPQYGLSDYLQNDTDLSDILIKPENINHFVILPAGKPLINSAEMLSSPRMCSLVDELKERYPKRIVLFDLPPVVGTADTLSFTPCVDATLLVVEDDVTREADLKTAIDYLSNTNIIGTVLNKAIY